MALTELLNPGPMACQAGGGKEISGSSFQRAIELAKTVPALVKVPPASSSKEPKTPGYLKVSSAHTAPLVPSPNSCTVLPFQLAMLWAVASELVDWWKSPPATMRPR